MKNKFINIKILLLVVIGIALTVSCQSDELIQYEHGDGYIQLSSVELDKNIQTRTASEIMSVKITNSDGSIFQEANDWTELQGKSFLVPAGKTYTIQAYSYGKTIEQGFDASPYYSGSEELIVKANTAHTVNVVCGLAQSMVTVSYSDNFKNYFSDYSATVTGNEALNLVFSATETRAAYVKANQPLQITLTLTPNGGEETSVTQSIVENALPAYRYNVKYDVDLEGSGDIDVSVDQNRHEYEITLGVPLKPDGITTDAIAGDASKVWGTFAYLSGQCSFVEPVSPVQFQYKKVSDSEWETIEAQKNESSTYGYSAKITSLEFGTEYQYKLVCGEDEGETMTFTTEPYEEIPNLNLDAWTQNGKMWYPNSVADDKYAEGAYWATGNAGVTTLKNANSYPVEDKIISGKAAKLETISITLAKYAAGNLFIGAFAPNGLNISKPAENVVFGRPYSGARPTKFKGHYMYQPGTSMSGGSVPSDRTLTVDECEIYIKLWAGESVIGEAHLVDNKHMDNYEAFELPIEYTDKTKHPDKITIVATSSRYGGEFSGMQVIGQVSAGSTLWVDEFSLSYE